jgi:hypothetical protein
MRAKWLLMFIGVMVLAGAASASTVDCSSLTTLSALIAGTNGAGAACQVGDVLITGVAFNSTAFANNATEEAAIVVSTNNNPPNNSTGAERGLNFNGEGTFANGSTFTITFNGTLCYTGTAGCMTDANGQFLASAQTLLTEGQAEQSVPGGSNDTTSNSITPSGGSTILLPAGPGNSNNPEANYAGTTAFAFSLGNNGQGQLNTVEGDVEETVGPEPSTMLLMGGALLGLATASRKLRKKA